MSDSKEFSISVDIHNLKASLPGIRVSVKCRKSKTDASGYKLYFDLKGLSGTHEVFFRDIMPRINKIFPQASITSGKFTEKGFEAVVAEY
jgi:hypothetical protein